MATASKPQQHAESGLTELSTDTRDAAREVLRGRRRGLAALLPFLGPAFIASVAYTDPGNFATNIQAGAQLGYRLLWVVVFANLAAMLFQTLAAKLGIVSGHNLAEVCRDAFPKTVVVFMWVVSEVAAIATDLAEFLGAVLALKLLFGVPPLGGVLATGLATYLMLLLQRYGFRPIEIIIAGFLAAIGAAYVGEVVLSRPAGLEVAAGLLPSLDGPTGMMLAVGIIGATVMPHALFVHSSLTQRRVKPANQAEARTIVKWEKVDVLIALGLAGLVNMAMLATAAAVFYSSGHSDVATIETADRTLEPLLGAMSSTIFLIALLVAGLSSSVVGTMAGQTIMQGFVGFKIPLWLRRLITMAPPIVVIALGVDATQALVMSQVVLSLTLPVPLVALVLLTSRREVMGPLANRRWVRLLGGFCAAGIVLLNALYLASSLGLGPLQS